MRNRYPRIFDGSALVALFRGSSRAFEMFREAELGLFSVCLPAVAVADAEQELKAGTHAWEAIFLTSGVVTLPLSLHTAVEIGTWPGGLGVRQVVHETISVDGAVVTSTPAEYSLHDVDLIRV